MTQYYFISPVDQVAVNKRKTSSVEPVTSRHNDTAMNFIVLPFRLNSTHVLLVSLFIKTNKQTNKHTVHALALL